MIHAKRAIHKGTKQTKNFIFLELLNLDLFGNHGILSLNNSRHCLVIIDTYFFKNINTTSEGFVKIFKQVKNEKSTKIKKIQSDHEEKFVNYRFTRFYLENGYKNEFAYPRTLSKKKLWKGEIEPYKKQLE